MHRGETSPSLLGPSACVARRRQHHLPSESSVASFAGKVTNVVMASSGEEALELLAAQPVDGISARPRHAWIVRPGDVQAHQTASRMARHPLIMLTARDDRDAMIEGINAGRRRLHCQGPPTSTFSRPAWRRSASAANSSRNENRRIREKLVRRETEATRAPSRRSGTGKARSAPARSAVLHRSLIESNIDALMTTDPLGINYSTSNKQMEALTGCTRDELIGAPSKEPYFNRSGAEPKRPSSWC